MARAHQEGCARARGVVGRGLEKPGILRGAWPHGTSRARGGGLWPALIERVVYVRVVWLVGDWKSLAYFAVRGRAGHVAPMAAGLWPALIKRIAHVRGPVPGFSIRGAWLHGTSRARGSSLSLALIKRVAHVRGVWLVGDWKGLAMGEFGRAQCIWVGQNPRAGWGQGAVLGVPCQAGRGGNRSGPNCFLVSFAQKLDAKNTGIPVKQRERHFAVILVG